MPSATGARVSDNAVVSAFGITVYWMVDASVTDSAFLHVPNDLFESRQIHTWISVELHIRNMTSIRKRMVRCFKLDLLKCGDGEVDGDMEAVRIEIVICYARNNPVTLFIHAHKSPRKAFCRGRQAGDV